MQMEVQSPMLQGNVVWETTIYMWSIDRKCLSMLNLFMLNFEPIWTCLKKNLLFSCSTQFVSTWTYYLLIIIFLCMQNCKYQITPSISWHHLFKIARRKMTSVTHFGMWITYLGKCGLNWEAFFDFCFFSHLCLESLIWKFMSFNI